jgi:hypothetical protein
MGYEGEITTAEMIAVRLFAADEVGFSKSRPHLTSSHRSLKYILILLFSAVSLFTGRAADADGLHPEQERAVFPKPLRDYHGSKFCINCSDGSVVGDACAWFSNLAADE